MNIFMKKSFMLLTYLYVLCFGFLNAMEIYGEDQGQFKRQAKARSKQYRHTLPLNNPIKKHSKCSKRYRHTTPLNINNVVNIGDIGNHSATRDRPFLPGNAQMAQPEAKRGCDDIVQKIYGTLLSLFSGGMINLP